MKMTLHRTVIDDRSRKAEVGLAAFALINVFPSLLLLYVNLHSFYGARLLWGKSTESSVPDRAGLAFVRDFLLAFHYRVRVILAGSA